MRERRINQGFTLGELLIVVAIIGVLVSVSLPTFTRQLERSRQRVDESNMRSAKAVAVAEYLANGYSDTPLKYYYDASSGDLVLEAPEGYGKSRSLTFENKFYEPLDSFIYIEVSKDGVTLEWKKTGDTLSNGESGSPSGSSPGSTTPVTPPEGGGEPSSSDPVVDAYEHQLSVANDRIRELEELLAQAQGQNAEDNSSELSSLQSQLDTANAQLVELLVENERLRNQLNSQSGEFFDYSSLTGGAATIYQNATNKDEFMTIEQQKKDGGVIQYSKGDVITYNGEVYVAITDISQEVNQYNNGTPEGNIFSGRIVKLSSNPIRTDDDLVIEWGNSYLDDVSTGDVYQDKDGNYYVCVYLSHAKSDPKDTNVWKLINM
ncbi:MAG: prepilin-type N-terminal cleavage/methylation domain-containing protein [Solobacterium sp.]|nr:prepilin-type N-terminal cleavage/methylation domain-containing protein [Solobacterium sp.]